MVTATPARPQAVPFEVHLDVFAGPFDLLLRLIGKHELDVTVVALAQVTDEFLAHLHAAHLFDMDEATEFLLVAATLLDLKAARLLPDPDGDAAEDLEVLEARDVLFARLLAYRAYKEVAALFAGLVDAESRWVGRELAASDLPAPPRGVHLGVTPDRLAAIAAAALRPPSAAGVDLEHVHVPRVSVREHALVILETLAAVGTASFRALCAGCAETIEVVARFLAVLELIRDGRVAVAQLEPLGELQVRALIPAAP